MWKSFDADRRDADRALDPVGNRRVRDLVHRPTRLQDDVRHESLEVGQEQQVGLVAGRDRAEVTEPVPCGRVERGHHERILGGHAECDCLTDDRVDVTVLGDVLRLAVVRAEREPVRPELGDERHERLQVAGDRGLADQHPHADAQPLAALFERVRLVIGADAGGRVRLQVLAEHSRRVAVDVLGTLAARACPARRRRRRRRRGSSSSRPARARAGGAAGPARSPGVSGRRGDSNDEAGTQDEAMNQTSSGRPAHTSSSQ